MTPRVAHVALGSNLGDRAARLAFAVERLKGVDGVDVVAVTTPESTPPLGGLDQPDYLNAMVRITFKGSVRDLLDACHRIEADAGRDRTGGRWASRTLDLDLVVVEDELCDRPDLTLPHPGLRDRGFWARQLAELERHG